MDPINHIESVLATAHEAAVTTVRIMPDHVRLVSAIAKLMHQVAGARGTPARDASDMSVRSLVTHTVFFYTSAIQKAVACQAYAVPVLTRSAIECIAYAARCRDVPDAALAWRRRHAGFLAGAQEVIAAGRDVDINDFMLGDDDNRRASRRHFERRHLEESLQRVMTATPDGPAIATALLKRYELAIDMGAHPNVLMTMLASETVKPPEGDFAYRVHYMLHADPANVRAALVGLADLGALLTRAMIVLLPECAAEVDASRRLHHIGQHLHNLVGKRSRAGSDQFDASPAGADGAE